MATTRPVLDLAAIREALALRDSVLADLYRWGSIADKALWRDRLAEAGMANRVIREEAERCGLLPVEAIGRATG